MKCWRSLADGHNPRIATQNQGFSYTRTSNPVASHIHSVKNISTYTTTKAKIKDTPRDQWTSDVGCVPRAEYLICVSGRWTWPTPRSLNDWCSGASMVGVPHAPISLARSIPLTNSVFVWPIWVVGIPWIPHSDDPVCWCGHGPNQHQSHSRVDHWGVRPIALPVCLSHVCRISNRCGVWASNWVCCTIWSVCGRCSDLCGAICPPPACHRPPHVQLIWTVQWNCIQSLWIYCEATHQWDWLRKLHSTIPRTAFTYLIG